MSGRQRRRRLAMGLATLMGRPRGWFIPYRYAAAAEPPARYPGLEPVFRAAEPAFREMLAAIERHAGALEAIGREPPPAPRWEQGWFPRSDGAAAYALVRERRPARIVEIGSGHSTRFLARAVADEGLATAITAIDPQPRADIARLAVRHVPATLQRAGREAFEALRAGDVLFVDSSHVAMPGTDVDLLVCDVLPRLPAGVLVHVHDILLPDGYPAAWGPRGYNEAQVVAGLLAGGGFAPVFASHYAATRMAAEVAAGVLGRLPLRPDTPETSLWLVKTAGPAGAAVAGPSQTAPVTQA
jgi:predicted O-methyltransferase YrrM